ncbi:LCP family protein [Kibdelosporangium phytohabitans]|uniref:LytTR family transcriptional regulator n=1 Tax=Kibdelosporangium phytohabitans TaxID=860235 RepID=A0A0N9HLL8_9PSEU|nr:LCP family protein [Kibdelosporangium phytohabitans]ALG07194.1 LytTR family transcriptional regulator [Kibdelosporangium phytohabitans]MBE1468533.1 LCP family protein required for cell wall assembly [Kibdelosporangium phytohabitans]
MIGGKVAVAVVSLILLGATGYGYNKYSEIVDGYTTANVIDGDAGGPKPADGATDILLVGLDSRVDAQGNPLPKEQLARLNGGKADGELNTDTIILMRIPNDGSKGIGVSIPRDSYVNIPGGYGKHKINSAYGRGKLSEMRKLKNQGIKDQAKLEVESSKVGARTLIDTIQELTGARIDNYAEVNLLGFADITDAVGGVPVCLVKAVNDSFSGARFPAGEQEVSGPAALSFVRQRHGLPNGDLDRIVRQQVFMKSMATKVLSAGTLTDQSRLDKLLSAIKKSIVLNQGWNIVQFAKQMQGMSGGALDFRTIPTGRPDLKTPEDGDAVEIKPAEVKTFVQGLLGGGQASPSSGAPSPSDKPGSSDNKAITVDVRNGNGKTGLANQVSEALGGKGFTAGETSNVKARTTTVIRHARGEKESGDKVAAALGGDFTVEQDTTLTKGHVAVFLGKDYKATSGFAGQPLLQLDPAPALTQQQPGGSAPRIGSNGAPCVN